jgi:hypothetical protein
LVEAYCDRLKPIRGVKDPKDPAFVKLNMDALQMLINGCRALIKEFPNTAAAKKEQELIDSYVLKG